MEVSLYSTSLPSLSPSPCLLSSYLANWDEFRHLCTIAFALIVLLLGACLVVAMGQGLFNIYDIYIHGEDTASLEGAHQSGTMIKKLVGGREGGREGKRGM